MDSLNYMKKHELVCGLDKMTGNTEQCDTWIKAKITRASFPVIEKPLSHNLLELLHMDQWSRTSGASFGGANYILTISG